MKWFFISLFLLLVAVYIFIQTPFGQNWIVKQVTKRLAKDLQTELSIGHVDFSLFNFMHLEKVMIEDRQGDTLLYAGDIKVKITDWFFIKKQAELKYIGLTDAVVKLQRTDSVWRHQFFFDYFSSPSSSDSTDKKGGMALDLKKADLENVTFTKRDAWNGQDMIVKLGELHLNAKEINFTDNKFFIRSLQIDKPVFEQYSYAGKNPTHTALPQPIPDIVVNENDSLLQWNNGKMQIMIDKLQLSKGIFKIEKQNRVPRPPGFNGQDMLLTDIEASITQSTIKNDTIFSTIHLSAKEKSGLEIKKMDADLKMSPTGMVFNNLDLQTNRSHIRRSFSMGYNDLSEMDDFLNKVKIAADFDNSYLDSDDIAFFAPAMKTWKKKISLTGEIRGSIGDLIGRSLQIKAGNNTILKGDLSITGLPNIKETFIDFSAEEFRTTYTDATTFIPGLRNVKGIQLHQLRNIYFTGNFTGFLSDFVTYGTIQTNLGVIESDFNMKLPIGSEPVFSGNLATDNFQLGLLLGNSDIGSLSMKTEVNGVGFSGLKRNIQANGNIAYVDFKGYRYHNIKIEKGSFIKNEFNGILKIDDENASLSLDGKFDLSSNTPLFKLTSDIQKINFKNLNLTKDDYALTGKLDLNFTGKNIDDFIGTAKVSEAVLTKSGSLLPFDSLILATSIDNGNKTLSARSNEFMVKISGEYNIADLPATALWFLNKYYPSYIDAPKNVADNQKIDFEIETLLVEEYVGLLSPKLSGFNYSSIWGKIDTRSDSLNLHAFVPNFRLNNYEFNGAEIKATGSADSLVLLGETNNVIISDSLSMPLVKFSVRSSNDQSRFNLTTSANQTIDNINLNAIVTTYPDGVGIDFDPSDFTINGKTWNIDENGTLEFRKESDATGELVLREGVQEIKMRTVPSTKGAWNDLLIDLKNLNIGDFSPFFMPENRLEGLVSGTFNAENPVKALKITSNDIRTQYLRLDNDSIGELKVASMEYDNPTKMLKLNGETLNPDNHLDFNVNLFFDKEKQADNTIALGAKSFNMSILNRFLGSLFADITGNITGDIDLKGPFNALSVTGKGRLRNAGLRVLFTQCFYEIEETDIDLQKNYLNLSGIILRDTVTGNPVYLNGGIRHSAFKNMVFDLRIGTQKPGTTNEENNKDVQLLRTTYRDNQQFYGDAKGTGSFTLTGPQTDMRMNIIGVLSSKDSSHITIPPTKSRESGLADFLVEKKYGEELKESQLEKVINNSSYQVKITANPKATVKVLLDDVTGDAIEGKGSGTITIKAGSTQPLSIIGRYDIQEGNYPFTFQSYINKPFKIEKKGDEENFIEWSGDPYNARINLNARYTATKVNYAPLVALSPSTDPSLGRSRTNVDVIANLTGPLFSPNIQFDLGFPDNSPVKSDQGLVFTLGQLKNDKNEMYKQVTFLIVMNSFAPASGYGGGGLDVRDIAASTVSGILGSVITKEINKILGKIFKNDNYTVSFDASLRNNVVDQNDKSALNLSSSVNLSIGRSFFNNRFVVTVTGGLDAPLQQTGSVGQAVQLLPDVTFEWLINESGTIRASLFYRENADFLGIGSGSPGKARKLGGNLSYKKDFSRVEDFFRRKKKNPQPPPAAEIKETPAKKEETPD